MIRSYRNKEIQALFENGKRGKGFSLAIQRRAVRKLQMLHAAQSLRDLLIPPGNRLEALKGDRRGQHSIRINEQYRICFLWKENDAFDIEIVDYHR